MMLRNKKQDENMLKDGLNINDMNDRDAAEPDEKNLTKKTFFKKGDTMVLIGDYLGDDTDYQAYISDDSEVDEDETLELFNQAAAELNEDTDTDEDEYIIKSVFDADDSLKEADNSNDYENDSAASKEKNKKRHMAVWLTIAAILILVIAAGAYRYGTAKTFAKKAKVNGIDVGGLDAAQVAEKMEEQNNSITLLKDGKAIGTSDTHFEYDAEKTAKRTIRRCAIDPVAMFKLRSDRGYAMPLNVIGGIEESAEEIAKLDTGSKDDVVMTADAYIDLDNMAIVKEVYGANIDYIKLTEAIAKQRKENPANSKFKFNAKEFYAKPKVKAEDLNDELEFDKKYLAGGLDVATPGGSVTKITPKQLGKVIKYSKDRPKYSKSGANSLAKELIKSYLNDDGVITVRTMSGDREVINYHFKSEINEEDTAKSIFNAAKNKTSAKLVEKNSKSGNLSTKLANRVEINLSAQTVTLVRNNNAVGTWYVVTGGPGHRTPTGLFAISYKTSPAVLKGDNADGSKYESPVTYWMPFNGGIGMHDADGWRSSYGGSIYMYGGSHGCVNMPLSAASTIYRSVNSGTPVVVYR